MSMFIYCGTCPQIEDIRSKYHKLEEELIESRKTTQGDMVTFMEEDVYKALCELTNHRTRADARLKHSNEVSV